MEFSLSIFWLACNSQKKIICGNRTVCADVADQFLISIYFETQKVYSVTRHQILNLLVFFLISVHQLSFRFILIFFVKTKNCLGRISPRKLFGHLIHSINIYLKRIKKEVDVRQLLTTTYVLFMDSLYIWALLELTKTFTKDFQ